MNDLDTLKQMFERASIVYEDAAEVGLPVLKVCAKSGPRNHGYAGFTTWFNFDKSGMLMAVRVDEG